MAGVAKLRCQVPQLIADYFQKLRDAEEVRSRDVKAATCIQAAARGFLMRRRIQHMKSVCVVIQRYWRGYTGRLRGKLALELRNKRLRQLYFDSEATIIQRHWRGFWSRRNVFDFFARKVYLEAVASKNASIRRELNHEADRAMATQRQLAETHARRLFDEKVSHLHHLCSTSSQPGVFNSPYSLATRTLPHVAGQPVEEHLRASIKAQLALRLPPIRSASIHSHTHSHSHRTSPAGRPITTTTTAAHSATRHHHQPHQHHQHHHSHSHSQTTRSNTTLHRNAQDIDDGSSTDGGCSPAVSHGRQQTTYAKGATLQSGRSSPASSRLIGSQGYNDPAMAGMRRLTLRQGADFQAVHDAALLEEKVHRGEMLTKHPLPFDNLQGVLPAPLFNVQSNRNIEGFHDPWDPTLGLRSDTFTPEQQAISASPFTKFLKRQPFFDESIAQSY